jgi:hypothetical protein
MPKICTQEDCDNNVWGKGYCKYHQHLRTDKKARKPLIPKKTIKPISAKKKESLKGRSEMDVFLEIWDKRPHTSELSGEQLLPKGHAKWHWQFLHVLPKGTFPELRLESDNVLLGLPEEHDHQDRYDVFRKKKIELLKMVYDLNKI